MNYYELRLADDESNAYFMYQGTTQLTAQDIYTLFETDGQAFFTFNFNSYTPLEGTFTIIGEDSGTPVSVIEGIVATGGIVENRNYKGTWTGHNNFFDSFTLLNAISLDEAQLSKIIAMIKALQ